jgi:VanZ family protein
VGKRYFFRIAFVGWLLFVTFSSLYSFEGVHAPRFQIPQLDKIVHFTFYFVACVLGVFFLRERSQGAMRLNKAIWVMVFSTISFGILIEIIQHTLTVNRMGDFLDGIANILGSLCAAIALKVYFYGKRQLKWKY